jgi:hypothetical protein
MFGGILKIPAMALLLGTAAYSLRCAPATGAAPVRRAVVVGIDRYRLASTQPRATPPADRILPKGTPAQRVWTDLDGAVNDAETMRALLMARLGFHGSDILTLENEQATAEAILISIQKHLIDDARPGDVSLLFFAGHGSLIRNIGTRERSGFDQTLVPADAPRGVPDIRDKELARVLRRGAAKGVVLTAIFDSCHSGSVARGKWNLGAKTRELAPDSRYVEDPPDLDATGKPLPDPESSGVLVLSASQDYQPAIEMDTVSGAHGLFTWALTRVLQTAPPNERVDRLFQRVRALMQSEGSLQEPVLAGAGRSERSLTGLQVEDSNAITAAVERVWDKRVRLGGGAGVGLNPGCELRRISPSKQESGSRIRVDKVLGLASAEAVILEGASSVQEGDLFQVTRWAAPEEAALHVFIPRAPMSMAQLSKLGAALSSLRNRVHWIEDPARESPTHVMSWSGRSWILERNPAVGPPIDLGAEPSAAALAARLPRDAGFLLILPVPSTFLSGIRLGPGTANDAIAPETSPARAHYVLNGRYRDGKVSYAWLLPHVTEAELARRYEEARRSGASPPAMAMPIRTDWTTDPGELTNAAKKLARIHGWLQLDAPADALRFPYHLALRDVGSRSLITGGTMQDGQEFKIVIASDPERLRDAVAGDSLSPRWIYVFCIDQQGKSTLLFPPRGQGNADNRFPLPDALSHPPASYEPDLKVELRVGEPFGIDTYFLLASEEPLPWPEALEFSGVRQDTRGGLDSLGRLIGRVGDGTRGGPVAVPANWSIDRLVLRSVEDGGGHATPKK